MRNEGVLPEAFEGCYVKAAQGATQAWKHHFMFKNNILHEYLQVLEEELIPKFY